MVDEDNARPPQVFVLPKGGRPGAVRPSGRWRRRAIVASTVVLALAAAAMVARTVALHRLADALQHLLGPRGSFASIEVTLAGLHLRGLRIAGEHGGTHAWPVDDELRADDVLLVPDLRSWWPWNGDGTRHIRSITVHGGYLAVLRSADGRLHVLPSLALAQPPAGQAAQQRDAAQIDHVDIDGVALDYIDAHVRVTPHRLRIDGVHGSAGPQRLPQADMAMAIDLHGTGRGPHHDSRIDIGGQLTPKTRDADLRIAVVGADLVALQPYLLKVDKGGVRAGTLDLSLHARIANRALLAPGSLVIQGLELGARDEGLVSRIQALPRRAVLSSMADHGRIALNFTLEGPLSGPKFKLDGDLATRAAGGVATGLGVTIGGLVDGFGDALGGLFGK